MSQIKPILERFAAEVSDFIGAGIVDQTEGTTIATFSKPASSTPTTSPADPQLADAYLAQLLILHQRAQKGLGRTGTTEDIAITTSGGLLLARPLPGTPYLWTLLTGPDANLPLTRALMRRFLPEVQAALPKA